jgi:hypothetical protein
MNTRYITIIRGDFMKKFLKGTLLVILTLFIFTGCTLKQEDIVGRWVVTDSYIEHGNGKESELIKSIIFYDDSTCDINGEIDFWSLPYKIDENNIIFGEYEMEDEELTETDKFIKCSYDDGKIYFDYDTTMVSKVLIQGLVEFFDQEYNEDEFDGYEYPIHKFVLEKVDF